MLGWCIMTLMNARLKASMWFPPLRGMYQKEALVRDVTRAEVQLKGKNRAKRDEVQEIVEEDED